MKLVVVKEQTLDLRLLWDSNRGWVLCLNRECNFTIKLLDAKLLNP